MRSLKDRFKALNDHRGYRRRYQVGGPIKNDYNILNAMRFPIPLKALRGQLV